METKLQIFENPEFGQVRAIGDFENPLFCLADVCRALDLPQVAKVVQRLDKDVLTKHPLETAGGVQDVYFIDEDGLYDVILESRKPNAKKFRKWLTSEVVPSIRKTGSYSLKPTLETAHSQIVTVNTTINDIGDMAENLRNVFGVAQGMALAKATTMVEAIYQLDLTEIKSLIAPVENAGTLTATEIAKLVGMKSAQAVNNAFVDLGFAERTNNGLLLTEEGKQYAEQIPFAASNGHCGYQIKWNQNVLPFLQ